MLIYIYNIYQSIKTIVGGTKKKQRRRRRKMSLTCRSKCCWHHLMAVDIPSYLRKEALRSKVLGRTFRLAGRRMADIPPYLCILAPGSKVLGRTLRLDQHSPLPDAA